MNGAWSYSGRGMFGRKCLAFTGLNRLLQAIRENPELPTNGWRWDSLGLDMVYYHPRVEAPLVDDDDDEDEWDDDNE